MLTIEFNLKSICKERLFSAVGANFLFEEILNTINKLPRDEIIVIIDFENIRLVSTSFIGRFQEQMASIKKIHIVKFKLINLKPEIKRQFMKVDPPPTAS